MDQAIVWIVGMDIDHETKDVRFLYKTFLLRSKETPIELGCDHAIDTTKTLDDNFLAIQTKVSVEAKYRGYAVEAVDVQLTKPTMTKGTGTVIDPAATKEIEQPTRTASLMAAVRSMMSA